MGGEILVILSALVTRRRFLAPDGLAASHFLSVTGKGEKNLSVRERTEAMDLGSGLLSTGQMSSM